MSEANGALRVIVYRDGDMFVAQGLEHDVAAQGMDPTAALDRLDATIEAELAMRGEEGLSKIGPAPVYHQQLWDKRSLSIERVNMELRPQVRIEAAYTQALLAA